MQNMEVLHHGKRQISICRENVMLGKLWNMYLFNER